MKSRFFSILALISCAVLSLCANAAPIARWSMDSAGIYNPAVLDGLIDDAVQCLWSPNNAANSFATSGDIPPASMLSTPVDSSSSYNAASIQNVDGALLYPQNMYGDRFSFTTAFTIELFFKSQGDVSGSGVMQLLRQGDTAYRFGLTLNEGSPGSVRFSIRDALGVTNAIDVASRNYADGAWHYIIAAFDPGNGGTMSLTVVNSDLTSDVAQRNLPSSFAGLPVRNDGNLLIGRNTYLRSSAPRTFLGLIDEVRISSGVLPSSELAGAVPGPIAKWTMTPAGGNNPAVLDTAAALGNNNLITFNSLSPANQFSSSTDVPPSYMFGNGLSAGSKSFAAGALSAVDGALFYPQDLFGNVFSFSGAFTIEMFFKTSGNRSTAGFMQLLMQGEQNFRYGLIVNEPGPGNVRFAINDGQGTIPLADLTGRNYADGAWHYLIARYVPSAPPNGILSLAIANQDGSSDSVATLVPSGFKGLPAVNDGNLFVGRNTFAVSQNPRTFLGFIDEVQISAGTPALSQRLGKAPAPFVATAQPVAGAGVSLAWSAVPGETYTVEYTESLQSPGWTPIHTQTASSTSFSFVDTNPFRLARSCGFYRAVIR